MQYMDLDQPGKHQTVHCAPQRGEACAIMQEGEPHGASHMLCAARLT